MSFIYFIILIGVLIFVHELGHFLAAKAFGVGVIRFSLGFGPKLFGFRKGETEYRVSWFPLGGYVKMVGDEVGQEIPEEERAKAFNYKKPWQRLIIALAGPMFNLIFPIGLYFAFYYSHDKLDPAIVGTVLADSPAEEAGLQSGDRVVEINGKPVRYWFRLQRTVGDNPEKPLTITVDRDGESVKLDIIPQAETLRGPPGFERTVGRIGVTPSFLQPQLGVLHTDSPAYQAGLRSWDVVTKVNGRPVARLHEVRDALFKEVGKEVTLTVTRGWQPTDLADSKEASAEGDGSVSAEEPKESEDKGFEEQVITVSMTLPSLIFELADLGIYPGENVVAKVEPDTPAWETGLREGDLLVAVNGQRCVLWMACIHQMLNDPEEKHEIGYIAASNPEAGIKTAPIQLEIQSQVGEFREEVLVPVFGAQNRSLLQYPDPIPNQNRVSYAISNAVERDIEVIKVTLLGFSLLVRGKVDTKSLGGPIMIFDIAGKAGAQGWTTFLWTMALISVNLGIINLLPIPILDGGHILFIAIEGIMRRPVPLKARLISAYVGLAMLAMLMVFAFKNDLERYWEDIMRFFGV